MANIIITNKCNLRCPYCFAGCVTEEEEWEMGIEEFREILNLHIVSSPLLYPKTKIGLIGGEPLLHSKFDEFFGLFNHYLSHFEDISLVGTFYTNGIGFKDYIKDLHPRCGVLINYNSPDIIGSEAKLNELELTLKGLHEAGLFRTGQATLGINIFSAKKEDYRFFFEAVDRYDIRSIRVSASFPCSEIASKRENRFAYFHEIKDTYMYFCKEAVRRDIMVIMDCSYLPECTFTKEEINIITKAQKLPYLNKQFCYDSCGINIERDGKTYPCFGRADEVINWYDYRNLEEIKAAFIKKACDQVDRNLNNPKCSACENARLLKCQGGCLGFSK